jgi:hypothetical protein
VPIGAPSLYRTPETELEIKRKLRKDERRRRSEQLKLARQRDSKLASRLREKFKEMDAKARVFTVELVCQQCNQPYTSPRKPPPYAHLYCWNCRKFLRRKYQRDYYASHREAYKTYKATQEAKKANAPSTSLTSALQTDQSQLRTLQDNLSFSDLPEEIEQPQTQPRRIPLAAQHQLAYQPRPHANASVVWTPDI